MKYMFSVLYMVQWNAVIHDSQSTSVYKVNTVSRRTTSWIPAKLKENGGNKESTHCQKWRWIEPTSMHGLSQTMREFSRHTISVPLLILKLELRNKSKHSVTGAVMRLHQEHLYFISKSIWEDADGESTLYNSVDQMMEKKKKKVIKKIICKQNW